MAKKLISIILCVVMAAVTFVPAFSADEKEYTISSPYDTVDWDTWGTYKSCLHAHTTFSDGTLLLSEAVEEYYRRDYDILAITDHGVLGAPWNTRAQMMPLIGYYAYIAKIGWLTDERYEQITTGSDREGRGMLNVTQGIELNAVTLAKNHVNGFFCDYGYNDWGVENDYEPAVKANAEAGGITFLNHLGDWTKADGDASINSDPETVQYFSDLYIKYPSCVGLEIINSGDSDTRNDRILWDNMLNVVIPEGRNIFGFSNDDSHDYNDIGNSFEVFMLPELTQDALRTAMETGTFFALGRRIRTTGWELEGSHDAPYPTVTNIAIDDDEDTITVTALNAETIEWVADGKVIATGASIDLNDYEDDITCYVRFQIRGTDAQLFSQPIICDDGTLAEQGGTLIDPITFEDDAFEAIFNLFESFKNTKLWSLIRRFA